MALAVLFHRVLVLLAAVFAAVWVFPAAAADFPAPQSATWTARDFKFHCQRDVVGAVASIAHLMQEVPVAHCAALFPWISTRQCRVDLVLQPKAPVSSKPEAVSVSERDGAGHSCGARARVGIGQRS